MVFLKGRGHSEKINRRISVIVPVYNRARLISFCLDSLISQRYDDYEVIVVDDASSDSSAELIRKSPVKLIALKRNQGSAHARNEGARIASGEYLAFTDSDCCVPEDWLSMMVKYFEQIPECVGVNGSYRRDLSGTFISEFAFRINRFKESGSPRYINTCNTSSFMCRRENFARAGGFPEFLTFSGKKVRGREDAMLAYSLTKDGKGKILMAHDIQVSHYFRPTWYGFISQQSLYASCLGMHGVRHSDWFSDVSSFPRRKTALQILCLGCALLAIVVTIFAPLAVIFFIIGLSIFILSYKEFLKEYQGACFKTKAIIALTVISLTWGAAGCYGLLKGLIYMRKHAKRT